VSVARAGTWTTNRRGLPSKARVKNCRTSWQSLLGGEVGEEVVDLLALLVLDALQLLDGGLVLLDLGLLLVELLQVALVRRRRRRHLLEVRAEAHLIIRDGLELPLQTITD